MSDPAPVNRLERQLIVDAPSPQVFDHFFSPTALRVWWQAARAIVTPVPFGVYAIEWAPTVHEDDVLGTLGGVLHGTVVEAQRGHGFLVADAYWVPPRGAALGPMVLQVDLRAEGAGCRVHVRQEGHDRSPRWDRYYRIISHGWDVSLAALKRYAEQTRVTPAPGPSASAPR